MLNGFFSSKVSSSFCEIPIERQCQSRESDTQKTATRAGMLTMLRSGNKIWKVALTDCRDVRRVKFIVRESAQQASFPNPRISKKQKPKEHIVLLSHGVRCCVLGFFFLFFWKINK